ncbi:hypothetical protein CDIK_4338 [Cucumispora dikerogammari]|nr:hypothetical protein CDIK_4338 [Cucumispora dikerogammari]
MWTKKKVETVCNSVVVRFNLCVKMNFLKEKRTCKECRKMMVLKEKNVVDDLRWRCLAKMWFKREIKLEKKFIFFSLRLPLKTIAMILYLWSRETQIRDIIHSLK